MNSSTRREFLRLILILTLLVLVVACETVQTSQTAPPAVPAQPYAWAKPGPAPGVRLQSGDEIEIKFAFASQFDQKETVRPDGKVELQLVGEVVVQGKTPAQLRDELMELYAVQLTHPQLAVIVKGFYERQVYVGGEVKRPGPVPMPGEMTALEAIMDAGGFITETAEARNVIVIRNVDGHMAGQAVDLEGALSGAKMKPFYLEPHDVVYVPKTCIANIDLWIQQHVWKLIPPVGLGATLY